MYSLSKHVYIPIKIVEIFSSRILSRRYSNNYLTNTWYIKAGPFWKLNANIVNCNLKIEAFDPVEYSDGNLIKVKTYKLKNSQPSDLNYYTIETDEKKKCVFIQNAKSCSNSVVISTPPVIDIKVSLTGTSSIILSNLESVECLVDIQCGNINLNSIKAHNINCVTKKGNISSTGLLQGNVKLKTLAGNICADKIQAPLADIIMDGDIMSIKDVYTDKFTANCNGKINIHSLHGCSNIRCIDGDVNIGTVEGETVAFANIGNLNIHAATPSALNLSTKKGNVYLSVAQNVGFDLSLNAPEIKSENVDISNGTSSTANSIMNFRGSVDGGGPLINIEALEGEIRIEQSTWMERITKFHKFKGS